MYVSISKAADITGLHPNTLRRKAREGEIVCKVLKSGHRRFDVSEFMNKPKRHVIVYCRVSSQKQKDDLERQVEYMRNLYQGAEVIKDIGSGINFNRKGLKTILERAMSGDVIELVVAHRDRLARFGIELIKWVIERNGGKLVVLNESTLSPEQELTEDILTILHVFSCRLHGLRNYKVQIQKDTNLSACKTTKKIK